MKKIITQLILLSSLMYGEGSWQLGLQEGSTHNQPMLEYSDNDLTINDGKKNKVFVDILNANEWINIHACGLSNSDNLKIGIFDATLSIDDNWTIGKIKEFNINSGNVTCNNNFNSNLNGPLSQKITKPGVYEIRFSNESDSGNQGRDGRISRFNINVSSGATAPTSIDPKLSEGRVWSYNFGFIGYDFTESYSFDSNLYVVVDGGFIGKNYVWQLDLNNFAGYGYNIMANSLGVNSPNAMGDKVSGISTPWINNSTNEKYPIYLSMPSKPIAKNTTLPVITNFKFTDNEGVDASISPGSTSAIQDTGKFIIESNIETEGTYEIIIDVDKNYYYSLGDIFMLGILKPGVNEVIWDGKDNNGNIVASGAYFAKATIRAGEYHFISSDVETSGGNVQGLTINAVNQNKTIDNTNKVYWDDATILNIGRYDSYNRDGNYKYHTWGDFSSNSSGDERFIDTYVYGDTSDFKIFENIIINDPNEKNPDDPQRLYEFNAVDIDQPLNIYNFIDDKMPNIPFSISLQVLNINTWWEGLSNGTISKVELIDFGNPNCDTLSEFLNPTICKGSAIISTPFNNATNPITINYNPVNLDNIISNKEVNFAKFRITGKDINGNNLISVSKGEFSIKGANLKAKSCVEIYENGQSVGNGIYTIYPDGKTVDSAYCNMTRNGGGWQLLFNRKGSSVNNVEGCSNGTNSFIQNSCGVVTNFNNSTSYSFGYQKILTNNIKMNEYWFEQLNNNTLDSNDSYIITSSNNLFPNNNNKNDILINKICDSNNSNCDTTDTYFIYIGDNGYTSVTPKCNSSFVSSTTYKGQYGYCANGLNTDSLNLDFGDRDGANEIKTWNYNNSNGSEKWREMVWARERSPIIISTPSNEYKFDECYYDSVANEVIDSYGNHGVSNNTKSNNLNQIINNNAQFNNSNIQLNNNLTLLNNTSTLMFWIKTSQIGNNIFYFAPGITGIEEVGGGNDIFWGWLDESGKIGFTAGNGISIKSNTKINDNVWKHITITRNAMSGFVQIYVNGVLENSGNSEIGIKTNNFNKLGEIINGNKLIGNLDELKIWDKVISAEEIKKTYDRESKGYQYNGIFRAPIICQQNKISGFNAVDDTDATNISGFISTKVSGKNFNLSIQSIKESGDALEKGNVKKIEIIDMNNINCNTNEKAVLSSCSAINTPYNDAVGNDIDENGYYIFNNINISKSYKKLKVRISGNALDGEPFVSLSKNDFSIKPNNIVLNFSFNKSNMIAEEKYDIELKAYNFNNILDDGYNGTISLNTNKYLSNNIIDNNIDGNVSLSNLIFANGILNSELSYDNVGKIFIELIDNSWTAIDSGDTDISIREFKTNDNFVFIPFKFDVINNTVILENGTSNNFTYLSNDLLMSAKIKNIIFTINAVGKNGSILTNYDNGSTNMYAKIVNIESGITIPDINSLGIISNNFPINETGKTLNFIKGSAILNYGDASFNFNRNKSVPIEPFSIIGADILLKFKIIDLDSIEGSFASNFLTKLNFYYGRMVIEDINTNSNTFSTFSNILIYSKNDIIGMNRYNLEWVYNNQDSSTTLSNYLIKSDISTNSSNLTLDSILITPSNLGKIMIDINELETNKYIVHFKNDSWLWFSNYYDFNFTDNTSNSNCITHYCLKIIKNNFTNVSKLISGEIKGIESDLNLNSSNKLGEKVIK